MSQFNIISQEPIDLNYQKGLLPQRNNSRFWYSDTSCRSNLNKFNLSSENRRIIRKTQDFNFKKIALKDFKYTPKTQKEINSWIKKLGWNFPTSSLKNIFTKHIFNYVYLWTNQENKTIAYSLCYFSKEISHIAYVFYHPDYDHSNLPIRLVLQTIIDCHQQKLKYCYLGRFSQENGFYKRNMPGFEYFQNNKWITYEK